MGDADPDIATTAAHDLRLSVTGREIRPTAIRAIGMSSSHLDTPPQIASCRVN
jgi:hypothetical protein